MICLLYVVNCTGKLSYKAERNNAVLSTNMRLLFYLGSYYKSTVGLKAYCCESELEIEWVFTTTATTATTTTTTTTTTTGAATTTTTTTTTIGAAATTTTTTTTAAAAATTTTTTTTTTTPTIATNHATMIIYLFLACEHIASIAYDALNID